MIDPDGYLRRVAYGGPREPSFEAPSAIVAGHTAGIPFENMDSLPGRAPLRFVLGLVQRTPGGTERIAQDGDVFSLDAALPAGWTPACRFTPETYRPVDYEPLNWYTASPPARSSATTCGSSA